MTNHTDQERRLYEEACRQRAANNGRVYEDHYFKRASTSGDYLNPSCEHGWQVWQSARAQQPASVAVPEGWKLVPVEPSFEIRQALYNSGFEASDSILDYAYRYVLSATREPIKAYRDDSRKPHELAAAGCNCVRFGEGNPHWPCLIHAAPAPVVKQGEPIGEIDEGDDGAFVDLYGDQSFTLGQKVYAAPVAQSELLPPTLTKDELDDLREFHQAVCCDAGHRVEKSGMRRLAEIGAVESVGFGKHRLTEFGVYLLAALPTQRGSSDE